MNTETKQQLYKNNTFRNDIVYENNDILEQSETLAPNYILPDTKIKNHTVIINSIDRNWTTNTTETPYNYLVKLGGSSKDNYSTVSHDYKNIVSFSVDKIIVTNRVCHQSYNSNIAPRLNDNPYITLDIKGINFSSYGTNKTLNNTIGIYTPLIPLPTSLSEISYLEFKNTSTQRKDYTPTPEGYISALDLSITTPNGSSISNLSDVLDIYSILLNCNCSINISCVVSANLRLSSISK